MKIFYLFTLALLASITCSSQQKFKEGQITLQNGTTINCFIKYVHTQTNPEKITYKVNIDDEEREYNQREIQGFTVENRIKFIKETVDFDNSEEDSNKLSYNKEPEYIKVTALLEVLIEGNASLYRLYKNGKARYFYKIDDNPIVPLIYKRYLVPTGFVRENFDYITELNNNVNCTGKIITKKRDLEYYAKELMKYFNEYNKCKGKESTFIMAKEKTSIGVAARVGYGVITSSINYEGYSPLKVNSKEGNRKDIGIQLEINLPYYLRKWSIIGDLYYYNINQNFTHMTENPYRINESSIKIQSLNVSVGFRYNIYLNPNNKKSKKIYIESLLDLLVFKVGDNYIKRSIRVSPNPWVSSLEYEYPTNQVYNLSFGVGFPIYKNLYGNIRHNLSSKYLTDINQDPITKNLYKMDYSISSFSGNLIYKF